MADSVFKQIISKASLIQLYLVYPKAQFLNRFCLTFFNDFFFLIPKASVHNFADGNTLCSFAKTIRVLVVILQSECETTINWLQNKKKLVNPDKPQVILLDKGRFDNTNIEVEIVNGKIRSTLSVKLLIGVHIDGKLNFNEHINEICKSAGNQLNSLIRLKSQI